MNDKNKLITGKFGIGFKKIKTDNTGILSNVYILDNKFVLRGRKLDNDTLENFKKEMFLIKNVKKLFPYEFPSPIKSLDGKRYAISDSRLWTVYPLISGRMVCSWQNIEKATDTEVKRLLAELKNIHMATKGKFRRNLINRDFFVKDIENKFKKLRILFSERVNNRIASAIKIVKDNNKNLRNDEMCFVHGDFHYGNLLVDRKGNITGILDFDFCRISNPLEDFAFALMMLLRRFKEKKFRFDGKRYEKLLNIYGLDDKLKPLLNEFLILYALYDLNLFLNSQEPGKQQHYIRYQSSMIMKLCATF